MRYGSFLTLDWSVVGGPAPVHYLEFRPSISAAQGRAEGSVSGMGPRRDMPFVDNGWERLRFQGRVGSNFEPM